jgi:hypothetical protein
MRPPSPASTRGASRRALPCFEERVLPGGDDGCIASRHAALAALIPNLKPEQLDELRTVMLANNEQVMEEMARRKLARRTKAAPAFRPLNGWAYAIL